MNEGNLKGNILLVDDSPINLRLLAQILTKQGYSVSAVESGIEALKSIEFNEPDLILLDIKMPEMDGFEVCEIIKSKINISDFPIIFISALSDIPNKVKAFEAGGIDFITKPFHTDEVIARVNAHMQMANLKKELKRQAFDLALSNEQLLLEIVEHKRADALLNETMQFNKEILSQLGEGIIVYNTQLQYIYWNKFMEILTGYVFEEVEGKYAFDLFPFLIEQGIDVLIKKALQGEIVTSHEFSFILPENGKTGWVMATYSPYHNPAGEIIGVIAHISDVTESKSLRNVSQATIDSLNANICVLNEEGEIILRNQKWIDFAKRNNDVLHNANIGINYIELCFSAKGECCNLANRLGHGIQSVLLGNSDLFELEFPYHTENEQRWFFGTITPIVDLKEKNRKVVITYEDITTTKLATEKVAASEEKYKLIAEKTSDVIWLMDLNGKSIYVSPSIERYTGYTPEEYKKQSVKNRFTPKSAKNALNAFSNELSLYVSNGKKIYNDSKKLELEYICKDGHTKWGELLISPYFDDHQIIQGIHCVTRDITERKQMEHELKEVVKEYYSLTYNLPAIVYRRFIGNDAETILYNNMFETILGYKNDISNYCLPNDGFIWMPIIDSDVETIEKNIECLLNTYGEYTVSYKVLNKKGEIKYLLDKGVGVYSVDKQLKYVEGSIFDISNEREAQIQLQHAKDNLDILVKERTFELESSNNFNEALLQNVPLGMLLIDDEENILFISDKLKSLLPVEKGVGDKCYECFRDNLAKCDDCPNKKEIPIGQTIVVETSGLLGDRTMRIFHTALLFQGKKVFLNVYEDITEKQQLQDEIKASLEKEKELNMLKSRFISVVSHEFRTPMAGILSSIQLLERFGDKWDLVKKDQMYKAIRGAINYTNLLLDDVSLVGKDDSGRLEFNPELININSFVKQQIDEISLAFNVFDNIDVKINLDKDEHLVDVHLLRHILNNILSNAIKYNLNFETIDFTINQLPNNMLQFIVVDHGIGIPDEDLPHIFETFHRATNVEAIKGTGLGLSVVKRCAELHNGTVTLESELGVGTTVTVTIMELNKKLMVNS